jgi:hypothetical protein
MMDEKRMELFFFLKSCRRFPSSVLLFGLLDADDFPVDEKRMRHFFLKSSQSRYLLLAVKIKHLFASGTC